MNHTRLGLVGWISYGCFGDSVLAVDMLVTLIKTLGVTELVSDALGIRQQKEVETNAKIVHLFKDTLDEIKNCRHRATGSRRPSYARRGSEKTSGCR